ncbi:MAG: putative flap endonuclease-1-like 5' DNA nuclease [Neolewinella sp.]|jgi:predicted flap endonuclease-1-like 5' DNA nuclease
MTHILLHVNNDPFLGIHSDWWGLWTLVAFAFGGFMYWVLWGRGTKEDCSLVEADRDRYHTAATKWEKDYMSLKYQLQESQKGEADYRARLKSCESDKQALKFAADGAGPALIPVPVDTGKMGIVSGGGSIYTGLFDNDNFQIIEGIGPKVNQVLIDAGYKNWSDLAAAEPADIKTNLDAAGKRFGLCDPTSWPHQAELAEAGDWDELIHYQKFTDGGVETKGDFETPSKFEKLSAKKLGFSSSNPNDLKVVEGVGPKIEGLLKADGINNWADLAAADIGRIQGILDEAGSRYKLAVPRTWPQQAGLAADGNWAALKALQDELQAGK